MWTKVRRRPRATSSFRISTSTGLPDSTTRPAPDGRGPGRVSMAAVGADAVIRVRNLRKHYGEVRAVDGVDFEVARGEVFGLLGPNGAGKTTTVEILEGYRERSGGEVAVLGHDPAARARELRERVGIVLQSTGMYRHITVREALDHS